MGLAKEKMRYFIIPLSLLIFVAIFPFAEYSIDCPTASDPIGNEKCIFTKHMLWITVSALSLTEFGFPSDKIFFIEENNPDAYHNHSLIPLTIATVATAIIQWRLGNLNHSFDRKTTEALR